MAPSAIVLARAYGSTLCMINAALAGEASMATANVPATAARLQRETNTLISDDMM